MEIPNGFLTIGLMMILVGVILIYKSLRAHPSELVSHRDGVIYLGSTPIIITEARKWIMAALGVTGMVIVWLISNMVNQGLIGWM